MRYNLGDYRYDKSKIYRKCLWFIFECIDQGPYTYAEGVKVVNGLCGIVEEPIVPTQLPLYEIDLTTKGDFLVHFKDNNYSKANDPMPAFIEPYGDHERVLVTWDNGWDWIGKPENLNVYEGV